MSLAVGRAGGVRHHLTVPRALVDLALYGGASAVALALDYALLVGLVGLGLNYLCASAISFCAGMGACYWLSIRFVFNDRRPSSREAEVAGFFAVGLAGLALTQLMLFLLVSVAHLPVAIAKVPTAGCVFLFNFVCRRALVFASPGRLRRIGATIAPDAAMVARLRRLSPTELGLGIAIAVVWGLGHTYVGLEGDARIYMGRALADLDPTGVGRDLMFQMDGQSAFTLFGTVAKALVAWIGLTPAAVVLSLTSLVAWFVAIVTFVRGLARGRALALVLTLVVVLPRVYTPWNLFSAGEALAVSRPFAEAGVILALAALCRERVLLCLVCLVAAAAFHPIMAAPGFFVLLVVLGSRDRRWLAAAALGGVAVLVAGYMGAPVASRLFGTIDSRWHVALAQRNPYLFLVQWPLEPFGAAVVQIVTTVIGGALLDRRVRIVLWASVAAALVGGAVSFLFCDLVPVLLVTQAQLWRWLWTVAALAPVAAGVCVWRLPKRGVNGQLALASLCAAWLWISMPLAGISMALVALGLFVCRPVPVRAALVPAIWVVVAIIAVLAEWDDIVTLAILLKGRPGGTLPTWAMVWGMGIPVIPLALLGVAAWRWPAAAATRILAPAIALAGLLLLPLVSDARTPSKIAADSTSTPAPGLIALLDSRPGPVLWLVGDEIWTWAHRPNWNSPVQGAGLVFSPDLARIWSDRATAVIATGLANRLLLDPWDQNAGAPPTHLDVDKIRAFCRRPDAPSWIVAPMYEGMVPPAELAATVWTSPADKLGAWLHANKVTWTSYRKLLFIPCAPAASTASH